MASDATREFAKQLGFVKESGCIDIVGLVELGNLDVACGDKNSQLELSVVHDELLPKAEAKTYPNGVIEIRESVYNSEERVRLSIQRTLSSSTFMFLI